MVARAARSVLLAARQFAVLVAAEAAAAAAGVDGDGDDEDGQQVGLFTCRAPTTAGAAYGEGSSMLHAAPHNSVTTLCFA